jgi:carboxyl-terminal processing protease
MKRTFLQARWGVLGLTVLVLLAGSGWRRESRPVADGDVYEQARLFETVLTTIQRQYIDSLGEGELYRAATDALVASLGDPYAELLTGEAYRQYRLQVAGNEVGAIAPELGGKTITRRVTPTTVHVSAASRGVLLDQGIGYVALHRVSEGAADELRAEIDQLRGQGMRRLVLDLRLNPGGLINQGVKIAGLFLTPGDTVATSVGRSTDRAKIHFASNPGGWGDLPLVVLVNRGTASSAELIAAALQDHDRAIVVGTPTYGKGVLQTTYPIGDAAAVKLTTARWFGPSGRNVQRPRGDTTSGRAGTTHLGSEKAFRTAMGRPVAEGRGIVPDLLVRSTARSEIERAFLATLGSDLVVFQSELGTYAAELANRLGRRAERFEVTRAMRDELSDRIVAQGVPVPREAYTAAATYVDDQLDYEVTRLALGPRAEARRRIRSDRPLQAALTVLRRAQTQEQALELAAVTRQGAR